MTNPLAAHDDEILTEGFRRLCGVDEVGRGPLAGPVVAAAVVLSSDFDCAELDDSKKLSAQKREAIAEALHASSSLIGIGVIEPAEIDLINILRASLKAMRVAIEALGSSAGAAPDFVLIDGNQRINDLGIPQRTVIKGDSRSASIAAASIVAKVHRDRLMSGYAKKYPGYGFEGHMGYATAAHRAAIEKLGPCPIHRTSFKGVREYLGGPIHIPGKLL